MKTAASLPREITKLVVTRLSTNFRDCTEIQTVPFPETIRPTEVIIKQAAVGINASDINYTAGFYKPGVKPPFDCGFEGIGRVVAVGENVTNVKLGDAVISQSFGAFTDYQVIPSRNVRGIPDVDVELLPLEISGTTASLALETVNPKAGETALVTAAAGGTGQFAVQLLKKKYGCRVIGTCSDEKKKAFLESMGCDRVVLYKSESLDEVLKKEFPAGVNVIYESVGGPLFDAALKNIAVKGRLITLGGIAGYKDGSTFGSSDKNSSSESSLAVPLNTWLLQRSASIHGFFMPHYQKHLPAHFAQLCEMKAKGELVCGVDSTPFSGLAGIPDAIEYLHAGKNCGKVVVTLQPPENSKL